ncbi:hypothetical protein NEOLEDRAFT_1131714 [Neolentinus lepideus HHB14362 ss-1]|uniref:Uncharacterized protein n=1 Tax=Neolentinus lepideus HHB14362 ss-1 TaxID=1314782 RepID=A0A165TII0_9AGAM|nr:hypothetical protein NEOLEDRAFT_1131714 [Neolentinus lepideus HHB14362 ss-1]
MAGHFCGRNRSDSDSGRSASSSSSSATPPSPTTPTKRRQMPQPLRLDSIGVDPSTLVGKTLTRIRRSQSHPALTLDFADNTSFQILVDGYDPVHKGIPKELEMDDGFAGVLESCTAKADKQRGRSASGGKLAKGMVITDCALIRLMDKAFERQKVQDADPVWPRLAPSLGKESKWDQNHLGLAFKFAATDGNDVPSRWHCVWATLAEYDDTVGTCTFRSYDDVYLNKLERTPRKGRAKYRSRNGQRN